MKIKQIKELRDLSVLANPIRLKILIALYDKKIQDDMQKGGSR